MGSKHVEAWNKLIVKQKFCASSWLITEIKKTLYVWDEIKKPGVLDTYLNWANHRTCYICVCRNAVRTLLCYCHTYDTIYVTQVVKPNISDLQPQGQSLPPHPQIKNSGCVTGPNIRGVLSTLYWHSYSHTVRNTWPPLDRKVTVPVVSVGGSGSTVCIVQVVSVRWVPRAWNGEMDCCELECS